jgi:nucleotide-binding universal stress UspA family protein
MVAVDSSKNAEKAYIEAINLAKLSGAKVTALSVVQLPDYTATVGEVEEAKREGISFYSKILNKIVEIGKTENVKIESKILVGHPADTIIKFVGQEKYDLIVMGHQGASGIKGFLMGSVSGKVLQHAACSVLIVK